MQSGEIRTRFLTFFEKRGHKVIPSASLVPENDPSVLFNTAGMQPLVPYLLGQAHPMGKRIVGVQKCVRTGDLEDIGDNRHFSFFEMMGNWSLGDYFKNEAIPWSYEFLTSKEEGLGLDVSRLYITVFAGDENAPKDTESADIWMKQGIPEHRIYFLPAEDNWWSPGDNGPCGPCSEMFYDMTGDVGDLTHDEFLSAIKEERVIEIWNDVFMEYEKKDGNVIGKLAQKNVDTGAGLERMTAVMQGKQTAYDTDIFTEVMGLIKEKSQSYNEISTRVLADHTRTVLFMLADGVTASNSDRGYVLRRLARRAIRHADVLGLNFGGTETVFRFIAEKFIQKYEEIYPEITIKLVVDLAAEESKFRLTLKQGLSEFEKGTDAFTLFTTYGFPVELTAELALEKGITIDRSRFDEQMKEHQDLSRTSSAGMFKGGLANHNDKTIKLHTAHHLLLAALQAVVDPSIKQRGSNITEERLRMDFLCDHKLTEEEKQSIEKWINDKITCALTVVKREMPLVEAEKIGAEMEFGAKYPNTVSVYFIEDKDGKHISKEFCGGPHVSNTSELGVFKIQKEEAVSAGIRRIKAVLL